jgi:hypothetical protein
MGLLTKLTQEGGSLLSEFDGTTPPLTNSSSPQSVLHNTYSINGTPGLQNVPTPSLLDLNGITPPQYINNLPE